MSESAILECRDVAIGFDGSAPLLMNFSAQICPGEMVALTGRSGSGKSTLLYTLSLMLKPLTGEVLVAGEEMSKRSDRERAKCRAERFGFVFQDAVLDPSRTVLDNILETTVYRMEPKSRWSNRAEELLQRFQVDVPPHRKPGQVSGGQAQRIAICRAILGRPRILIADEPTGSLDSQTGQVVIDALRAEARNGSGVLIATHDQRVVQACDRAIHLTQ